MRRRWVVTPLAIMFAAVIGQVSLSVAARDPSQPPPKATGVRRVEFEVVESFDARYSGDTPGHIGRQGELKDARPLIALGDPVYRDEVPVGYVTRLEWSRVHGSLEVEFAPLEKTRIRIGEVIWLRFGEDDN